MPISHLNHNLDRPLERRLDRRAARRSFLAGFSSAGAALLAACGVALNTGGATSTTAQGQVPAGSTPAASGSSKAPSTCPINCISSRCCCFNVSIITDCSLPSWASNSSCFRETQRERAMQIRSVPMLL